MAAVALRALDLLHHALRRGLLRLQAPNMARSPLPRLLALLLVASASCSLLAPPDSDLIGGLAGGAGAAGTRPGNPAGGDGAHAGGGAATVAAAGSGSPDGGTVLSVGGAGNAGNGGDAGAAGARGRADLPEIPRESLVLWLAGDRGVHLVDGAVDRWADQSGNGMDAFKNTANQRPKPTPMLPDQPSSLVFDGVDDNLSLGEGFADFTAGATIFAVARQSVDSDCSSIIQLSNGSEVDDVDFGRYRASSTYEVLDGTVTGVAGAFTIGKEVLLNVVHRPDETVDIRINGEFSNGASHIALPALLSRSKNFIGRSLYGECSPFAGNIAEVLLYSRALSLAEVQRVEAYLSQKWQCCGGQ